MPGHPLASATTAQRKRLNVPISDNHEFVVSRQDRPHAIRRNE
jgi:hypothetical protein